ncbi:polysaccharide lyase family 4 protein [Stipitochalara longipes BDJ]|nr:polysaccharide lyase family 4 protein [Stipitochalara longipes BDJ]
MRLNMLFCVIGLIGIKGISAAGPFFLKVNPIEHVIGNDIWNITIGPTYGTKLFYKNKDIVGDAQGHYLSYNGGSFLNWTSARIYSQNNESLDVSFEASEGDFHWVIYHDLAGAYQYFVNKGLPVLGEFRSLVRLDNATFFTGKTASKEGLLPTLAEIASGTKYYGVYGSGYGNWYIYPGKDEYNGDHMKQELLVHRESRTGDVVLLNMLHGTHFMASSNDYFEVGKTWGPWLWYLNNGSTEDASNRAKKEIQNWPYNWYNSSTYQSRGSVFGTLNTPDGRLAANAAIFLGDNNPNETTLDMGRYNYYITYADSTGFFRFDNVRTGTYAIQAWSDGPPIGDLSAKYLQNDIQVNPNESTDLSSQDFVTSARTVVWRIGDFDRKALGFRYGGLTRQHALVEKCPANLTFVIGVSKMEDWCFAQSSLGSWNVLFNLTDFGVPKNSSAVLSVSLAGFSGGVSNVLVNGKVVAILGGSNILADPSLYRSATTAGEWHYFEFGVGNGTLQAGDNEITFKVMKSSRLGGFMWDALMLEWAGNN